MKMKITKRLRQYNRILTLLQKRKKWGLNHCNRDEEIIVSLTSYPQRYSSLLYVLASLLCQTMKPDRIIVYLAEEEVRNGIPKSLLKAETYGVETVIVKENIKPHKKYYYAMQMYPNALIITVDDDILYPESLIEELYNSHLRFPDEVIISRAHGIKFKDGNPEPYSNWEWRVKETSKPSFSMLGTNGAGTLFPPNSLHKEAFDIDAINMLALEQDDLWIKIMEVKNNKKVVLCNPNLWYESILMQWTQDEALCKTNVGDNKNDIVWKNLLEHFQLSESNFL